MKEAPSNFEGITAIFNTTEDCNLACSYCYEVNKKRKTLDIETAKKFINKILDEEDDPFGLKKVGLDKLAEGGLILEFIGGDALMKPKLVREIINYFIWESNLRQHRWCDHWRMSISTNGTFFENEEVRKLLEDFRGLVSLTVSLDGVKEVHDLNRKYIDGKGSFDDIMKNWKWYLNYCHRSNCNPATKSTLSKESIPYIYDSLVFLHEEAKLNNIYMNFVMENMNVQQSDLDELDRQLEKCYHYMLKNQDFYWSLFEKNYIGRKQGEEEKKRGRCGSGMMPSLSIDGKIYPCHRWMEVASKRNDNLFTIGDVESGINKDKLEFPQATMWDISDEECRECEIATACPYCIAGCYAEFGEMKRTKYVCGIIKIISKWTKKYWEARDEFNTQKQ